MKTKDILSRDTRILSQDQRESYFELGYVGLPAVIDEAWLTRLRSASSELIEKSLSLKASDGTFDLEDGHTAENPRLRRIAFLDDLHPVFWEFSTASTIVDIAEDILGPNVTFRESLINYKWSRGGQGVQWHQDLPSYPHTNLSPAQFLVFLEDIDLEQGPAQVIPGSHRGKIFDHYDDNDQWLGYIPNTHLEEIDSDNAVALTGPAGTVTGHHGLTVHSSKQNLSDRGRPLLITGFNASDALPYTAPAYPSSHHGTVIRGEQTRYAHLEPAPIRLPPDWSCGYTSIFSHQTGAGEQLTTG